MRCFKTIRIARLKAYTTLQTFHLILAMTRYNIDCMEAAKLQAKQVPYSGKPGLLLNDIQLHSLRFSNTAKWYEKLLFLFHRQKPGRIYTNTDKFFTENGRVGLELSFPISKEMLANQKEAAEDISKFRMFTPRCKG